MAIATAAEQINADGMNVTVGGGVESISLVQRGPSIDDVNLWKLNEAFASRALYYLDHLSPDPVMVNVDGKAISIGHPYGMPGHVWSATPYSKDDVTAPAMS